MASQVGSRLVSSEKSWPATFSGTHATPRLIAFTYSAVRPQRFASSVAMSVKSRTSPCGSTAGWRSAKPAWFQNCSTYLVPPMRISCRLSRSLASGSSRSAKWFVSSRVKANATTNGKRAIFACDAGRVPERDRGVGAVDEPQVRQRHARQALRRLVEEHPREVRRPQRLAPRAVGGERHHRAVGVADVRLRAPARLVGRVERVVHEPVGAGLHALVAVVVRAVEAHRRADRAARHLQRADQRGEHRARPHALVAAPAVVDGLAQRDRDGAERQRHAVDLDRLAHVRVVEVLVGDAADRRRGNLAHVLRPFRA